jgi:hypothetical protein
VFILAPTDLVDAEEMSVGESAPPTAAPTPRDARRRTPR